jgi:multidrug efflux pump subunit AcrA (membrane-fusion protein)
MARWLLQKKYWVAAAIVIVAATVFGTIRLARSAPKFPMAAVQQKEFVDYVEVRGAIKALKSTVVTAPAGSGDLQILNIVTNGVKVKKGDVVVEFDATTVKQNLALNESALKSADAGIQQSRAASKLKEEQDLTDVMKARFDVETARMETRKQEIISAIEGAEAKLKLADTEQKLLEVEAKLKADRAAAAADLASKQRAHDQAEFQVKQAEHQLASLTLRSPSNGVVVLQVNWQASGPMQQPAPFKPGDHAWPGATIAELPDTSSLQITARVEEAERGRVQIGQSGIIRVDAVPDRSYNGKVEEISTTASPDFNGGWPFPKNFTLEIALPESDSRLTPGMGAIVRIAVDRVAQGMVIPTEAIFRKEGRSVVYVRRGSKFEEVAVEVSRRSGNDALIAKGVRVGEQLALKDPTQTE